MLPKKSVYIKTFKAKGGDKNKNNEFISLCIDDYKLLRKRKTIWAKIEDIKVKSWMLFQFLIIDI